MNAIEVSAGGAVVFWSAGPTQRELLDSRLDQIGLAKFLPLPRTDAACLKDSLKDYCRGPGLAYGASDKEVQAHVNPELNGFEVVNVQRGNDKNHYTTDFSAKLEQGEVTVTQGLADLAAIQQSFGIHSGLITGQSVGAAMVQILAHLKGVSLRPRGSVYWLPGSSLDVWRQVAVAVEECCMGGSTKAYVMTTVMDSGSMRAVKDAVCREVTDASEVLRKEIIAGDLGERALEKRVERAQCLHSRIEEYQELLGDMNELLHAAVRVPEMAAAAAIAVSDDVGVFDDLLV
jgi:hypothetical protein